MTEGRRRRIGWRALSLALCYALALQAILASFGTALAMGKASGPDGAFAICHGDGGPAPAGDNDTSNKLPCALCAVACAGGGLIPEDEAAPAALAIFAGRVTAPEPAAFQSTAPVRAGLARAPPTTL